MFEFLYYSYNVSICSIVCLSWNFSRLLVSCVDNAPPVIGTYSNQQFQCVWGGGVFTSLSYNIFSDIIVLWIFEIRALWPIVRKNQKVMRKSVCFGRGEVFIAYLTDMVTDDLLRLVYICSQIFVSGMFVLVRRNFYFHTGLTFVSMFAFWRFSVSFYVF